MGRKSARGGRASFTLSTVALCVLSLYATAEAAARADDGCRSLRAIFYVEGDALPVAQALAKNASPCAQYFVSVPPLAADHTQMRGGVAPGIRALGANFHALAEVNVSGWQGWVASTGGSWYDAGVEARRRMAAAGFDLSNGDSWAVNEFSSAVRTGAGTSRQAMRDLVRGLYYGDGTAPPVKGVVFVVGVGQPTAVLSGYKANLESWLQDAGFWGDMSSYVSDFMQENYGDLRDYGVAGADIPTRLGYLNAYLEHLTQLASVAPPTAGSAQSFLAASSAPLASAAWAWSSGYGYTAVPFDQMEDYVSAEVDAMRSYDAAIGWSADRLGFAWAPSNSLGLSASDFSAQTAAILARVAAAIQASADPAAPGAGACLPPWCTAVVGGAAFTPAWEGFSAWTPTSIAFTSAPVSVAAGSASGPISLQLRIGGAVAPLPIATDVLVSSSSSTGSFSTSAAGPWSPALDLTIPAGSTTATLYMLDQLAGTPIVTATTDGQSATQAELVSAQAPGPPTSVSATAGDGQATVSFGAPASDGGAPVSSYTVTASPGGATASGPASPIAVTGLTNGTSYTFTVTAVNAAGSGQPSAASNAIVPSASAAQAPGPPTSVSATAGDGQATVSFSPPASNGGAAISSYTVTSSPGGLTASGSSSPLTATGLTDGTTYTFTVTATNSAGTGPSSAASNAVTPQVATATLPGPPIGAAAVAGDGQATVSFGPPATNGGSPISSFTVTATPGGAQASGSGSPITIAGLSNGQSYTFTVSATNGVGTGPASSASNAVTPSGGGGGGGGGGSSSLTVAISPGSQTVSAGGTASWTVSVTNTGGAYLYAVSLADAAAPSCGTPSAYAETLSFMAPTVNVTYTCSLSNVTTSLTNTVDATAATAPGPVISARASATVTVPTPAFTPPAAVVDAPSHRARVAPTLATVAVSGLKPILLDAKFPRLSLTVRSSAPTTLVLTLLDDREHKLAEWVEHEEAGTHRLSLPLPARARRTGHSTLRISETGRRKPQRFPLTFRA